MASGRTVWADQLSDDERSVLGPGTAEAVVARPDVLVVGGGIVGVATALACHRSGLGQVSLLEAAQLGSGTTAGAAGLLVPEAHQGSDPDAFVDLGRTSLKIWQELEGALPGGLGYQDMDWVGLAPQPAGFVAEPPTTVEWLSAGDVQALVPGLSGTTSAALVRHQGRVNPLRAVSRMAAHLPHVTSGAAAIRCEEKGDRVLAIETTAGLVFPGAVIFATGGPPELTGMDLKIPADWVKGHLAATEPVSLTLPGSVAPVATQIEGGRLLAGGTVDANDLSPGVNKDTIEGIRRELQAALPQLKNARLSHQWCCWRPHHPDSQPVVDRVPGLDNAWFTSGHYRTGILMAPVTAQMLSEWVSTGQRPEQAVPWAITGRW
jgi:glycine/D-amino acid oxidase-like deaminating enzyme